MKVRVVICDIYGALLEAGPPPKDAKARWEQLCGRHFGGLPPMSLAEFARRSGELLLREHGALKALGVTHSEVVWPPVAMEALPELARLTRAERDEFLFEHAQLQHSVRPLPHSVQTLAELRQCRVMLALLANCQAYTLKELETALARGTVSLMHFRRELNFFSFEAGFRKPDPHVFRLLAARLETLGIRPEQALVVGGNVENDIAPAWEQGFQGWLLTSTPGDGHASGDWKQLSASLNPAASDSGKG